MIEQHAIHILGAGVTRQCARLSDGRELFYYDDPGHDGAAARPVDARDLPLRPPTAEMRRDPLSGEWIAISTARQHRAHLPPAEFDPLAPQTPGNPSEIPGSYDVAVFENRSPAFGPGLAEGSESGLPLTGLGRAAAAVGRCEVVCFSPEFSGSFGSLTVRRARTVIEAWADRTAALSKLSGIEQVFVFENRGAEIGVTLPHPHGQIYAYPYVTPRTAQLAESVSREGSDLLQRVLAFEQASERVVLAGEHWTAFVPFAARWPLEVHLMPHRQVPDFAALDEAQKTELAPLYLRLLRAVDQLYATPTPYIAAWHQAPVHQLRAELGLRLELTSPRRAADKLKYLAGSEAAMGAWIADLEPEHVARELRAALDKIAEVPE